VLDEPADAFVEGFVGRDRGFRSLSFQPASVLNLDRVKVVRDVETASGPEPILVVDGDARPVGWADSERPGQVFPLGATFSPETDSLRGALDSALTSPYGLAVAVTADTRRYAGVVSADAILDKVRDLRTSIVESISIREAETAYEYEPLAEPDADYEELGEPDYAAESADESAQLESAQDESAQLESAQDESAQDESAQFESAQDESAQFESAQDESAQHESTELESAQTEPAAAYAPPLDEAALSEVEAEDAGFRDSRPAVESSPGDVSKEHADDTISIEQPESISEESEPGETAPGEDHPTADGHREGQEANGEAHYRRDSGILQ
jgi:osmoprotectant transport system ATP-binding protein